MKSGQKLCLLTKNTKQSVSVITTWVRVIVISLNVLIGSFFIIHVKNNQTHEARGSQSRPESLFGIY